MIERRHLLVIYTIVFFGVLLVLVQKGLYKGGLFDAERFNDFRAYHLAAEAVWQGDLLPAYRDPSRPFQYPPPFAFLVSPFGLVPYRLGVVFWALLNGVLVVLIFRRMDRILALALSAEAKLAGFFLVLRMLESDFSNGNANLLVLALVLLALDLARSRRDVLGGVSLGAACLAKVSPVFVLPWLVYRRRWRMLGGVAIAGVVLGGLVPLVSLGPRDSASAWRAWSVSTLSAVDVSSREYGREPGHGYVPGQSVRALLHRLLRKSDATAHDDAVVSVHLLDLSKWHVDLIYYALAAAILAAVLLGFRYRNPGMRRGWTAGELAAACLLVPLLGPLSRKAHFVLLWPAAVVAFESWWRAEGRSRWAGALVWGGALVLVVGTSPDIVGRAASTLLLAYCPYSWAALCLLALLLHPGLYPRSPRRLEGALTPECGAETRGG